jgi:chemotaxis protein CheC
MLDFANLTTVQLDVLREIGNVGAGNAATSLSQMLGRKIEMTVPRINILPFRDVADAVGGGESLVAGVFLQVTGSAPSSILFIMPIQSASLLIDLLMGRALKADCELTEMDQSALREIGNILAGSYLNALGAFTSLEFNQSVPALAVDMAGAILSEILYKLGQVGDYALVIETEFIEDEKQVKGHFFLLPEPGSLDKIMESLGVKG